MHVILRVAHMLAGTVQGDADEGRRREVGHS
jgi:hypothetical protein